jgi:peroxiredoxin
MKKILFAVLLLPVFGLAQSSFTISGTATGFSDGAEVKLVNANDNTQLSSGKIAAGKFILKGAVDEPVLTKLTIASAPPAYIYVENKKITVAADKQSPAKIKVTGSTAHNDFTTFQVTFNPLMDFLNSTVNELNMTPQGDRYNQLLKRYDSIKAVIQQQIDIYITNKPGSYLSPFVLFVTTQLYDDPMLLESRYLKLDTPIQNSIIGKSLGSYISYNKVGAVGTKALDFTQPDTTGKPVALSSFRGRYVLVDFWASWCGPCRAENPNVVESYVKFKEKNFTVLGVSLDKQGAKDSWIAAIKKDNLTWTHVSDLQHWNNAAAQLYHVGSIPFNILVNPEGKIIAKNLRGPALQSKLCEVLGCN